MITAVSVFVESNTDVAVIVITSPLDNVEGIVTTPFKSTVTPESATSCESLSTTLVTAHVTLLFAKPTVTTVGVNVTFVASPCGIVAVAGVIDKAQVGSSHSTGLQAQRSPLPLMQSAQEQRVSALQLFAFAGTVFCRHHVQFMLDDGAPPTAVALTLVDVKQRDTRTAEFLLRQIGIKNVRRAKACLPDRVMHRLGTEDRGRQQ